jgi:integrase
LTYPVYLRIHFRGKTDYIRINDVPNIHKKDWIGDARRGRYINDFFFNQIICDTLENTRKWANEQIGKGVPLTTQMIKAHLNGGIDTSETFNQWCHNFVRTINKDKSTKEKRAYRTIQAYKSFLHKLDDFNPAIRFDELNKPLIKEFDKYLSREHDLQGVTRLKYWDKFKVCYRELVNQGFSKNDADLFSGLNIKKEDSKRVSLNKEEVAILRDAELNDPRDRFTRDIYVFECLTGMLYADVEQLKWKHVSKETILEHGQKKEVPYISKERDKSKVTFKVPLFPDAQLIIERYGSADRQPEQPVFTGLVSSDKFRKRLRRIAADIGIHKALGPRSARHTFGEMMTSMNMSSLKIATAMGHKDLKSQQTYVRQSTASALYGWIEPDL